MKQRREFSEEEIAQMADLSRQHYSTYRIGLALGRDAETVRRKMVRLGIARQPKNWKGEMSTAWRGGHKIGKGGYILIYMPGHPYASGNYVPEHRLAMERLLGRYLTKEEVVHHKDGDPRNNTPENLELYNGNNLHLKDTLKGKAPQWSETGRVNILMGVHRTKGKHYASRSIAAKLRPPRARGANGRYLKQA
jgi:ribosomal protein L29